MSDTNDGTEDRTDDEPPIGTNDTDRATRGEMTDATDRTDSRRRDSETTDARHASNESTEPTAEYATEEDLAALREDVAEFADDLDERTVERDDLESDLRRYVRRKVRSNHARGWGPYLVLLYGTAMTIAAFYSPNVGGGWVILAMLVIWLSTLGLYTLFVIVGVVLNVLSMPGRLRDRIGEWRS